MDRRKRLLVNPYEEAVDAELRRIVERHGGRICPKVRMADVLEIQNSGITEPEYSYTLKAHFDFTVARATTTQALFAVEFDGPTHETDVSTTRRDLLKDTICAKLGLPLLRISANYLQHVGRFTVVGWLAEMWFLYEAWQDAQERNPELEDEPFLFFLFQGFDPFIHYRAYVERLFHANRCAVLAPEVSHVLYTGRPGRSNRTNTYE